MNDDIEDRPRKWGKSNSWTIHHDDTAWNPYVLLLNGAPFAEFDRYWIEEEDLRSLSRFIRACEIMAIAEVLFERHATQAQREMIESKSYFSKEELAWGDAAKRNWQGIYSTILDARKWIARGKKRRFPLHICSKCGKALVDRRFAEWANIEGDDVCAYYAKGGIPQCEKYECLTPALGVVDE